MKHYHNGHYIKLIPARFSELANIGDYLEDEHGKRLLPVERKNLVYALFCQRVEIVFLQQFRKHNPLESEQIGTARPTRVTKVVTNDGQEYFVLRFNNGAAIRCPGTLYAISPVKNKLKYATGLNTCKIPPPGNEQLQISFQ
nr:hypothetical protein [uncultured Draconibacterium sp.]